MEQSVVQLISNYVDANREETETLLKELGRIPSPTRSEDKRAAFIKSWLEEQGAEDVYIDEAKNVICPVGLDKFEDIAVFQAHTDIVFPDTEPLPMTEDGRILRCPGIGDDTSNLVNLLMCVKYILKHHPAQKCGLLFVANACEEGLGNLDGTKAVVDTFGDRMKSLISFDGYISQCTTTAVGSHRYRITVKTTGGHSWIDYGRASAIDAAAELICRLKQIQIPTDQKTTSNVGTIKGGSTVNSIAQECSMLYEFRSISQKNLTYMENELRKAIKSIEGEDIHIDVDLLGVRPGNGPVDPDELKAFTDENVSIIHTFSDCAIDFTPMSTDANVPLSRGIVANTIGTVTGALAHTRQEWVDLDSLPTGGKIAFGCISRFLKLIEE